MSDERLQRLEAENLRLESELDDALGMIDDLERGDGARAAAQAAEVRANQLEAANAKLEAANERFKEEAEAAAERALASEKELGALASERDAAEALLERVKRELAAKEKEFDACVGRAGGARAARARSTRAVRRATAAHGTRACIRSAARNLNPPFPRSHLVQCQARRGRVHERRREGVQGEARSGRRCVACRPHAHLARRASLTLDLHRPHPLRAPAELQKQAKENADLREEVKVRGAAHLPSRAPARRSPRSPDGRLPAGALRGH